jgi:hypothetical protein
MRRLLIFIFLISLTINAQDITWTDISGNYDFPDGVELYKGTRESPRLNVWYLDVDLSEPEIAVRSYISNQKKGIVNFSQNVGAIAAINGGYFDINSATSYSTVIYPGEVKAQNVKVLNRPSGSYPATRSYFGMSSDRELSVEWIYHFGASIDDVYKFDEPLPNSEGSPAQTPSQSDGTQMENLFTGIGGGPTLVKNGEVNVTYEEEVFFGSGVGKTNNDPRTAVGYTEDKHVIMLVADGRQDESDGVGLPELAEIMIDLGCVEAMNLDGGGSTQMAADGKLVNTPVGGTYQRPLPTILTVVDADSLPFPKEIYYEDVIDTGDDRASLIGDGWFTSANQGYYGDTPAYLNEVGTGESSCVFEFLVPKTAEYEIFGWWVSSSNRSENTPFIIEHANGTDTVGKNQVSGGSAWQSLGSYELSGEDLHTVSITDDASAGNNATYVVADAIRIVSYDSTVVSSVEGDRGLTDKTFKLYQNYPNPFNPSTKIKYIIPRSTNYPFVRLKIYDILGNEIVTLVNKKQTSGKYEVEFSANTVNKELSSGVYIYRLQAGEFMDSKKFMLLK